MAGTRYTTQPVPLTAEKTTMFDAGRLCIGVEVRDLNEQILDGTFEGDEREIVRGYMRGQGRSRADVDAFVSIHVLFDGAERLRFDDIGVDPHYHYVVPEGHYNDFFQYDPVANGHYLDWVFTQLRANLAPMLEAAGIAPVAGALDRASVDAALEAAEAFARAEKLALG